MWSRIAGDKYKDVRYSIIRKYNSIFEKCEVVKQGVNRKLLEYRLFGNKYLKDVKYYVEIES